MRKRTYVLTGAVALIAFAGFPASASAQCLAGCTTNTTVVYGAGSVAGAFGVSRGARTNSRSDSYTQNEGFGVTPIGAPAAGYAMSAAGAFQRNTARGSQGSAALSASGVAGVASMTLRRSRVSIPPPGNPN
jgi:hypothetical protein